MNIIFRKSPSHARMSAKPCHGLSEVCVVLNHYHESDEKNNQCFHTDKLLTGLCQVCRFVLTHRILSGSLLLLSHSHKSQQNVIIYYFKYSARVLFDKVQTCLLLLMQCVARYTNWHWNVRMDVCLVMSIPGRVFARHFPWYGVMKRAATCSPNTLYPLYKAV